MQIRTGFRIVCCSCLLVTAACRGDSTPPYYWNAESVPKNASWAASCSSTDVSSAISSAASGDTVAIPAGTCAWSGSVSIDKPLTIQGAGIDKTVITGRGFFIAAGVDDYRITGITFDGNWGTAYLIQSAQSRTGNKRFRIDHNKFKNKAYTTSGTILFHGYSYGVVDHNIFQDCLDEVLSIGGDGNPSYDRTPVVGGYENGTIFIEDNQFTLTSAVYEKYNDQNYAAENLFDCNSGPRVVFRHNTVTDHQYCRWLSAIEAHGFESEFSTVGDARGVNSLEIYDNRFISNYPGYANAIKLRGGRGVIFGNTFSGTGHSFDDFIHMRNIRSLVNDTSNSLSKGNINAAGYTMYCHSRQPDETGLICEKCTTNVGICRDQVRELYIWDNTNAGGITVDNEGYIPTDIVLNTNYFLSSMPGYVPYPYPHPLTTGHSATSKYVQSGMSNEQSDLSPDMVGSAPREECGYGSVNGLLQPCGKLP